MRLVRVESTSPETPQPMESPSENPVDIAGLCPECDADLELTTLTGITVSSCPECHGIWLRQSRIQAILQRAGMASLRPDQLSLHLAESA